LLNYCIYAQYTTTPERVQKFAFGEIFDPDEVGHERFLSFVEDAKLFFANQRAGESIFYKTRINKGISSDEFNANEMN
jgi:hypothetical protein